MKKLLDLANGIILCCVLLGYAHRSLFRFSSFQFSLIFFERLRHQLYIFCYETGVLAQRNAAVVREAYGMFYEIRHFTQHGKGRMALGRETTIACVRVSNVQTRRENDYDRTVWSLQIVQRIDPMKTTFKIKRKNIVKRVSKPLSRTEKCLLAS